MSITSKIIYLAIAVLPILVVASDTQNIEVNVGEETISVIAPQGFHEVTSISVDTRQLAETMTPPTNELLAVFLSEEDLGILMTGGSPNMGQYLLLQTAKEMTSINISGAQFSYLSGLIKEQHKELLGKVQSNANQLFGNASKELEQSRGIALEMSVGDIVPLGIFLEQPEAIGFATLSKYQFESDNGTIDQVVVMGSSNILVRGKVLFAYVYRIFESQADIDWVRSISRDWAASMISSNRSMSGTMGGSQKDDAQSSSNWNRVAEKGINGLIVGGFLTLIFGAINYVGRKFSRKNCLIV